VAKPQRHRLRGHVGSYKASAPFFDPLRRAERDPGFHPISGVRITCILLQQGLQAHESGPNYLVHPTGPARGTCSPRSGPFPPPDDVRSATPPRPPLRIDSSKAIGPVVHELSSSTRLSTRLVCAPLSRRSRSLQFRAKSAGRA